MTERVVIGKRRFTCLADGLVRLEFSPSGEFTEQRSMVAYAPQRPVPFARAEEKAGVLYLETARMSLRASQHDRDFFPANLEIRWRQHGLLQYWRPGDRDHRNLGGTIFSLDRFTNYAHLHGVQVAGSESPDAHGLRWVGGIFDLEDSAYYAESGRSDVLQSIDSEFDFHGAAQYQPEKLLVHTLNNLLDQYQYAPAVLSQSGYFLLNDSTSAVLDADDFPIERNLPGHTDWYFFCYGLDYREALRNFMLLSGRAPLPPRHTFGLMSCRWPGYSETEARELIERYQREGIPLSTIIIDMEWHKPGWCNWDWEQSMYPDPAAFFAWAHERGVQVSLNVHPQRIISDDSHFAPFVEATHGEQRLEPYTSDITGQPVRKIEVNIGDKAQALAFMDICHRPIVDLGVDFWWLDGYQGAINGTHPQLVANKLYYENAETAEKRSMLLARYAGLGSHRYGAFFTADTRTGWGVLQLLCEFNIRAGHAGVAYVSHDVGGFAHPEAPLIDPLLFLRWLQFSVFNPVLRFHAAPGSGSRHPWDYGAQNMEIARSWLRLRNSLLPYLYTAARLHYDTGLPLVRGLFLLHPEDSAAYRYDEFYFGDALLVAPMLTQDTHRTVYLPAGRWVDFRSGEMLAGGRELFATAPLSTIPVYVKAGSILPCQWGDTPAAAHVERLLLDVYPGDDGTGELYEDDGTSQAYRATAMPAPASRCTRTTPLSRCARRRRKARCRGYTARSGCVSCWRVNRPACAERHPARPGLRQFRRGHATGIPSIFRG